jgi:16S rRNA A1518/A1519 N6-dimethyltransferase RsmA/KsgA/DIM1 with predicted DNA glycosylase/AP lyase activity
MRDDLESIADPALEQHFLVSTTKISQIIEAAAVRPLDHVAEFGAGAGTVARMIPACASLTLIELDARLARRLRQAVPGASVVCGDALRLAQEATWDVLIGNLPSVVTESLLEILPLLSFRTAVLAVGESTDLDGLAADLIWSEVTTITGDDFRPPQTGTSRVVRLTHAKVEG